MLAKYKPPPQLLLKSASPVYYLELFLHWPSPPGQHPPCKCWIGKAWQPHKAWALPKKDGWFGGAICLCLCNTKPAWLLLLTNRGSNETSIWTIRKLWALLAVLDPSPRGRLPWTSSGWPRSEEDEVGIDSHMVSRYGRLLTAHGGDTVPGRSCSKAAVWYAPCRTNPCLNTWKWPQGCTVRDGYLLTVRTVLQELLIIGENQGNRCYCRGGPAVSQSISLKTSARGHLLATVWTLRLAGL